MLDTLDISKVNVEITSRDKLFYKILCCINPVSESYPAKIAVFVQI